jgi:hypothetical protein
MGRCRFVQPEIVRLPLSDGDFIDVKRELTAGETRRIYARMMRDGIVPGEKTVYVPEQVGLTKMLEYIIAWSFVDGHGAPVEFSEDALKNLDVETFREIAEALDVHQTAQEARREADRKNRSGATGLRVISGSVAP